MSAFHECDACEPLVDAHCHLQLDPLYQQVDEVIHRAHSNHVSFCCVCATIPGTDWERVATLANRHSPFIIPAFGLHPWWILRWVIVSSSGSDFEVSSKSVESIDSEDDFDIAGSCRELEIHLRNAIISDPRACVGECGLDKPRKKAVPMAVQELFLDVHLQVANELRRPLILHCVGCWGRLLEKLREFCAHHCVQLPSIIMHSCNSMSAELLPAFLNLPVPIYWSFTAIGSCTENNSGEVHRMKALRLLRDVPSNRLLIETDAPDQLPVALRTDMSYNEPCVIRLTCKDIAAHLCIPTAECARQTLENAKKALLMDV